MTNTPLDLQTADPTRFATQFLESWAAVTAWNRFAGLPNLHEACADSPLAQRTIATESPCDEQTKHEVLSVHVGPMLARRSAEAQ